MTCRYCGHVTYVLIGGVVVCADCDGLVYWPRFHRSELYDQDAS